jgi:hypothetical protein
VVGLDDRTDDERLQIVEADAALGDTYAESAGTRHAAP